MHYKFFYNLLFKFKINFFEIKKKKKKKKKNPSGWWGSGRGRTEIRNSHDILFHFLVRIQFVILKRKASEPSSFFIGTLWSFISVF